MTRYLHFKGGITEKKALRTQAKPKDLNLSEKPDSLEKLQVISSCNNFIDNPCDANFEIFRRTIS